MFFNITNKKLKNYVNNYELINNMILNCDDGWHKFELPDYLIYIKGYSDKFNLCELSGQIIKDFTPTFTGNFVAVIVNNDKIIITNDVYRGSPVRKGKDYVTNLEDGDGVWCDKYAVINFEDGISIEEIIFNPYNEPDNSKKTETEIINTIHSLLCDTYDNFLSHNKLPLKIFLSGGLDTLLAYSYLEKFTSNFELIDHEYFKFTPFWVKNSSKLLTTATWGYTRFHLWDEPCVLVTGTNGDENFLRGAHLTHLMLRYYNTDMVELIKGNEDNYSCHFYNRNKDYYTIDKYPDLSTDQFTNYIDLQKYILNRNINDHQHWHLDQTLTFTPFKNIKILENVLKLPRESYIKHVTDAYINRQLLVKNNPNLAQYVCTHKNVNTHENLLPLFNKHNNMLD